MVWIPFHSIYRTVKKKKLIEQYHPLKQNQPVFSSSYAKTAEIYVVA
jgi:hypothetical protein